MSAEVPQSGRVEDNTGQPRSRGAWVWLEQSVKDLLLGLRQLAKAPVYTSVAVLSLALGIGANTAVFTTIDALFLRGLPVHNPQELVRLGVSGFAGNPGRQETLPSPYFEHFRDQAKSLAGVLEQTVTAVNSIASAAGEREPVSIRIEEVSGNYFSVLGVPAALGRALAPEDDRTDTPRAVAVLSYACWQSRFGGDAAVVGKTIRLENADFSIVGIAPAGFIGLAIGRQVDAWIPIHNIPLISPGQAQQWRTGRFFLGFMGRLRPGVTSEQAEAELDGLYQRGFDEFVAQFVPQNPRLANVHGKMELIPGGSGYIPAQEQNKYLLKILMTVTGLVLIVACANVTGLQLARIAARQRELTILAALGAGRGRLIWRLMAESVLLATAGGALGLLLAHWGTVALFNTAPDLPKALDPNPDASVLLFTLSISALAAICAGLIPALKFSRVDLVGAIKDQSHTHTGGASRRMTGALVSVQIALSVCLLAGAGLFVRSLQNLQNVELGFRRENLLLVNLAPRSNYDAARRTALSKSVLSALAELPGVRSVTFGIGGQFTGTNARVRFQVHVDGFDPPPGDTGDASLVFAGPRYLETMGIVLTAGRDFGDADMVPKPGQPPAPWVAAPANAGAALPQGVVIVDESFAKKYFGTNEAVGHIIRVGNGTQANRIIGVAKNIKYDSLREVASPEIFFPYSTVGVFGYSFQLHTAGNPLALATSMQAAIKRIDPNVNVSIRTETDVIDAMTSTERMIARFSSGFSLFALGLACLGLYGVLSYNVAQRTREIGVRMALGAQVSAIARLVVQQGVVLAAIGCVFGVAAAIALSRYVTSTFYGVSGADPVTLAVVVVLLIAVALVASWLPARRATRINPITALRSE